MYCSGYIMKNILNCDTSHIGLGCVSMQEGELLKYFNKNISGPVLNYTIILSKINDKNIL